MIDFLKRRSYDLVHMFITQLAISIFGMALALATAANHSTLQICTSVFAVLFYLYLIYAKIWELGYKDIRGFERGDKGLSRFEGLYMGLAASTINFILALLITLGISFPSSEFFGSIGAVAKVIALLVEGMYTGLLALKANGISLNSLWFMYFLITLPLIITASLAYFAGSKEFKIFTSTKNKSDS